VLLDRLNRLESLDWGDVNTWMHQPGIMPGTLKLNLRFTKAETPLSLGTGRGAASCEGSRRPWARNSCDHIE
jgi:hypothetical protein